MNKVALEINPVNPTAKHVRFEPETWFDLDYGAAMTKVFDWAIEKTGGEDFTIVSTPGKDAGKIYSGNALHGIFLMFEDD